MKIACKLLKTATCFSALSPPHMEVVKIQKIRQVSITHHEILKAIELNKPRWLLAHENVVFTRTLLNNLGYRGKTGRAKLNLKKNQIFTDLRIIDLYEEATIDHEAPKTVPLAERRGNWVQKFRSDNDGSIFVSAQFFRYQ